MLMQNRSIEYWLNRREGRNKQHRQNNNYRQYRQCGWQSRSLSLAANQSMTLSPSSSNSNKNKNHYTVSSGRNRRTKPVLKNYKEKAKRYMPVVLNPTKLGRWKRRPPKLNKRCHLPTVWRGCSTLQATTQWANNKIPKSENRTKKLTIVEFFPTRSMAEIEFHLSNKKLRTGMQTEFCQTRTRARTESHLILRTQQTNEDHLKNRTHKFASLITSTREPRSTNKTTC